MLFEVHLAINGAWDGSGGIRYANVHAANAPGQRLVRLQMTPGTWRGK